jgi:hypothetical protein
MAQLGGVGLTIIKTLTELFKLRQALKGEPPKEAISKGDEIHITTVTTQLSPLINEHIRFISTIR